MLIRWFCLEKRGNALVDCGYPGSLGLLEIQLERHNIRPESITTLVLTHQNDDHIGAAAEIKGKYPVIQVLAFAKKECKQSSKMGQISPESIPAEKVS